MNQILIHYEEIHPTTWAYVSSLMVIGLFFKFSRFWSVRNLDLGLLILLAPGLLLIHFGQEVQKQARQLANSVESDDALIESFAVDGPALELVTGDQLASERPTEEQPPEEIPVAGFQDLSSDLAESATEGASVDVDDPNETVAATFSTPASREHLRGVSIEQQGFVWIFVAMALILWRLLIDPAMVRRPLLDPNLTLGGLTFVCCALFVFLMANVITGELTEDDLKGPRAAKRWLAGEESEESIESLASYGPGFPLLHLLPSISTTWVHGGEAEASQEQDRSRYVHAAKLMAILSQLAIVLGMIVVGYRHFENIRAGMGAAVLYLLLPYTTLMTERLTHVLPAALLIWAIVFYRRPEIAGGFLGFAIGVVYYPFFLLPLWISFYWQKGLVRFLLGVVISLCLVVMSLALTTNDLVHFGDQLRQILGLMIPRTRGLEGFWQGIDVAYRVYRFPVLAAFIITSLAMALWPAQKNLGTLIGCSATVMLATQYWQGDGGGMYMAWYMPLVLLTIFRPNLEDRVALAVLGNFWPGRRGSTDRPKGRTAFDSSSNS